MCWVIRWWIAISSSSRVAAGRTRCALLPIDLKTFFTVIDKTPLEVTTADVFEFLAHQRGDRTVIRISDGESRLSARTIARRLSSISGFYVYLVARGDTVVRSNPVPRGIPTRRQHGRRHQVPLVRVPRTLPKVLSPAEVNALLARCAVIVTGRWSWRWCSAVCAAARSSVCDSATFRCRSVRCSSPRARAAITGSCRSRTCSSPPSATTCASNGQQTRRRTGCS